MNRVNAAGQEIAYAYDALGNVVEQLAGEELTSFGYDEAGRLALARNTDADIVVARDALGRVTAETRYAFDQQCRVTAIETAASLGLSSSG